MSIFLLKKFSHKILKFQSKKYTNSLFPSQSFLPKTIFSPLSIPIDVVLLSMMVKFSLNIIFRSMKSSSLPSYIFSSALFSYSIFNRCTISIFSVKVLSIHLVITPLSVPSNMVKLIHLPNLERKVNQLEQFGFLENFRPIQILTKLGNFPI